MSNAEVSDQVPKGYRLTPPQNCPEGVASLMLKCWEYTSTERPAFKTIAMTLRGELRKLDHRLAFEVSSSQYLLGNTDSGYISTTDLMGMNPNDFYYTYPNPKGQSN